MRPRSPLCSQTCELVPQMMSSTSAVSKPLRSTSAREHGCRDVLRVQVRERALARLADPARRAAGVDDEGVGHGRQPSSPSVDGSKEGAGLGVRVDSVRPIGNGQGTTVKAPLSRHHSQGATEVAAR